MRKFLLVFCVLTCLFVMGACSNSDVGSEIPNVGEAMPAVAKVDISFSGSIETIESSDPTKIQRLEKNLELDSWQACDEFNGKILCTIGLCGEDCEMHITVFENSQIVKVCKADAEEYFLVPEGVYSFLQNPTLQD